MVHSEVLKMLFFACFRLLIFQSILPGGSANPICPYVRTPMSVGTLFPLFFLYPPFPPSSHFSPLSPFSFPAPPFFPSTCFLSFPFQLLRCPPFSHISLPALLLFFHDTPLLLFYILFLNLLSFSYFSLPFTFLPSRFTSLPLLFPSVFVALSRLPFIPQ